MRYVVLERKTGHVYEHEPDAPKTRTPKDVRFNCYICGSEAFTYRGLLIVPPDPFTIHRPRYGPIMGCIQGVSTCGSPYCESMEQRRVDAIFNMLIEPEKLRYYAERAERLRRERSTNEREGSENANQGPASAK
jgi:hypothetical protein